MPPKIGSTPKRTPKSSPRAAPKAKAPKADKPATAKPAAETQSTIWKKLERFDVNHNGTLEFSETKDVFDKVGLPGYWSLSSAIATAIARGPIGRRNVTLEDLKHPERLFQISLGDIGKSIVKGQSGVWNDNATSDPAKAKAFIKEVDGNDGKLDGKLRLEGIKERVEKDAAASVEGMRQPMKGLERKKRFAEAYSAWVQLMEIAGKTDTDGSRYLSTEQAESVFNGKLFDMIFEGKPDQEKISVARIFGELVGSTITS